MCLKLIKRLTKGSSRYLYVKSGELATSWEDLTHVVVQYIFWCRLVDCTQLIVNNDLWILSFVLRDACLIWCWTVLIFLDLSWWLRLLIPFVNHGQLTDLVCIRTRRSFVGTVASFYIRLLFKWTAFDLQTLVKVRLFAIIWGVARSRRLITLRGIERFVGSTEASAMPVWRYSLLYDWDFVELRSIWISFVISNPRGVNLVSILVGQNCLMTLALIQVRGVCLVHLAYCVVFFVKLLHFRLRFHHRAWLQAKRLELFILPNSLLELDLNLRTLITVRMMNDFSFLDARLR